MSNFSVDIFTPSKILIQDVAADSLLIPTESGEINPLPGHTHMISKLDTGILTISLDGKESYFSITGGICKILDEKVTIISKVSEKPDEIDQERSKNAKIKAEQKLKGEDSLTRDEIIKYRRKLERAEMRLKMSLLK